MKSFEASGRTVEEAISAGLSENGLSIGDVSVEILEEGSKGLFGLFGSRNAKVRLTLNDNETHADTMDLFRDSLREKPAPRPREEAARPQPAPAPRAPQVERKPKPAREPQAPREPKPVKEQQAPREPQPKKEQPASEAKPPRAKRQRERKQGGEAPLPAVDIVREVRILTPVEQPDATSPAGIAQQFLVQLTGLMGLAITVSVSLDPEGHVFATLDGDPQGILIGRRGETLDALQYLTSLRVNKGQENYVRVTIDSEGYRQKREEALIRLANRMANRARKTGRRVSMDPMNPYERRIFHSALQSTPGIATHSEGEEPNRHVVITPVKEDGEEAGAES